MADKTKLEEYRDLLVELRAARARGGLILEDPDEEVIADALDLVWEAMSDEDREEIRYQFYKERRRRV